jgi:hypothetical protein
MTKGAIFSTSIYVDNTNVPYLYTALLNSNGESFRDGVGVLLLTASAGLFDLPMKYLTSKNHKNIDTDSMIVNIGKTPSKLKAAQPTSGGDDSAK